MLRPRGPAHQGPGLGVRLPEVVPDASRKIEGIIDQINDDDTDRSEIPDFVSKHARKMIENPTRVSLPPNKVVSQDGKGDYTTIGAAVASVPPKNKVPYVILVKAGVYNEYVLIPSGNDEVVLLGEGPTNTIIYGDKSYVKKFQTYDQGTLSKYSPSLLFHFTYLTNLIVIYSLYLTLFSYWVVLSLISKHFIFGK